MPKQRISTLGIGNFGNVPKEALAYVLFLASLLEKASTNDNGPSPAAYPF